MSSPPLGRYEILQELGRGAMGVVYKARDPLIDRMVAVKSVDLDASLEEGGAFERRFYREAKSAGGLNHVNIVTIHDVGRSGDNAYIAMELLEGRSLRDVIDSGVVLPQEQIADIAAQVADGLACAHRNGVVHRDIKPANVMLLDTGIVKITDFGIALLPRGSRTMTGVFGSPKYISPEQVVGKEADGRSDIFALGAVLYELLTGAPAFTASDLDTVLSQVIHELPEAPSKRNRNIATGFDAIVAKAMAKNPDDRYTSAEEMAQDLRDLAGVEASPSVEESPRALDRRARRRAASEKARLKVEAMGAPAVAPATGSVASEDGRTSRSRKMIWLGSSVALLAVAAIWTTTHKRSAQDDPAAMRAVAMAPALIPRVLPDGPPLREVSSIVSPGAVAQTAPAHPSVAADKKVSAAPVRVGRLAFAVSPWGEVYVDGRRRGISPPLQEIKLPAGKHVVEIRNTKFKRHTQTVDLVADASVRIKHKFQ